MTLPNSENICLVRGDDYSVAFEFDQAVGTFSEIAFTIRTAYATTEIDNTTAVFAATKTGGDITVTGTYTVSLDMTHTETLAFTAENYVYDLQVTTSAGKLYTTQRGRVRIIPDVTR